MQVRNLWTDDEVALLKSLYGNVTIFQLVNTFPRHSRSSIVNKALKLNLRFKDDLDKKKLYKKHSHNESFFSVPNIINSYWAGFIAADGCCDNSRNALRIQLGIKDINVLERFKEDIQSTSPISIHKRDSNTTCKINIYSATQIKNDLYTYWNITPRKTLTLLPPNIKDFTLIQSYIIGFTDGDGYWSVWCKNGSYNYHIGWSGTLAMMEWIQHQLYLIKPGISHLRKCIRDKNYYYSLKICGQRAIYIRNKLKEIPLDRKMKRKWAG